MAELPLPNIGAANNAIERLFVEENDEAVANANRGQAADILLPNVDAVDGIENVNGNHAAVVAVPIIGAEVLIDGEEVIEILENANENQDVLLPLPIGGAAAVVDMAIVDQTEAQADGEPFIEDENANGVDQESEIGRANLNEIQQVKLEPIVNELSVEQMMELDDMLVEGMPADPLDCSSGPEDSDSNGNSDIAVPGCSYIHSQKGMDQNAMNYADDSDDSSDYEDAAEGTQPNNITWVAVYEDVLMEHNSGHTVQPMQDTNFDLVKHENDIISGNIQFRDEVCVSTIRINRNKMKKFNK